MRYDIMMIGTFAVDHNVVDGVGEIASGGAVYYGAVPLSRMGLHVAVVTRMAAKDMPRLQELRAEGIDVYVTPSEQTTGIENTYRSADMERRICRPLGFAGKFDLADFPEADVRIYGVLPLMAGEVDLQLLRQLAKRGPVALDVQGFVRVRDGDDLVFKPWADMKEGLACVTYLKVDKAEAEALTGETDVQVAALRLSALGPREVVLTQTSGVTVLADGRFYWAPFTPRSLAGRTGRGDTCFATYLGRRLSAGPAEACRLAGVVTSLKQEQPGPWRGEVLAQ